MFDLLAFAAHLGLVAFFVRFGAEDAACAHGDGAAEELGEAGEHDEAGVGDAGEGGHDGEGDDHAVGGAEDGSVDGAIGGFGPGGEAGCE